MHHAFKHGGYLRDGNRCVQSPTYRIWAGMKARCSNPNHPCFHKYGGKGISVCERWHDYANFLADMGERPGQLQIDRIDPRGNYCPENCRWLSAKDQQRNRTDNRWITANNETLLASDWALRLGIKQSAINNRIARGMAPEDAVTLPKGGSRGK
jgi:hypothetical protein